MYSSLPFTQTRIRHSIKKYHTVVRSLDGKLQAEHRKMYYSVPLSTLTYSRSSEDVNSELLSAVMCSDLVPLG
jgi:hypothetical protein